MSFKKLNDRDRSASSEPIRLGRESLMLSLKGSDVGRFCSAMGNGGPSVVRLFSSKQTHGQYRENGMDSESGMSILGAYQPLDGQSKPISVQS